MRHILREPLLYFLLAGAALFGLTRVFAGDDGHRIVVTEAERARLSDQWQAQMGRPPTATELKGLVDQWIREEVYYREALAMGLDDDDVIVRRRLAQKLTFLKEDIASTTPPDEATLRAFYQAHRDRYTDPARFTFVHRFFSADRRRDPEGDARRALDALIAAAAANDQAGDPSADPVGDPFMLQLRYTAASQQQIAELFGGEFAASLAGLPPGTWQGPVKSAYGWHLVRVDEVQPPRLEDFAEVANQVSTDYREDRRRQANEDYYQSLLGRYQIVRR